MPIVPIFNPTTGAGGTAPSTGGGGSADWTLVDLTDGSWTFSDPSTAVANATPVVKSGDAMTFKPQAYTSQADYTIVSGTGFTGPRWYKELYYEDGTRVNSGDNFIFVGQVNNGSTTTGWRLAGGVGFSEDPTSSVSNTIGFTGAAFGSNAAGAPNWAAGVITISSSAINYNSSQKASEASIMVSGDYYGAGSWISYNTSGDRLQNGSRNNNFVAAPADLYLTVLWGPSGAAAAGPLDTDLFDVELRYTCIKLEAPIFA